MSFPSFLSSINQQECDEFAIRSQQLWGKANEAGVFDLEMAPLEVKGRKGVETVDTESSIESRWQ